jgi:amidase
MTGSDWLKRDAVDIAHAVQVGDCSALELLDAQLNAIDRLDPQHHVYITQTRERARSQATSIDAIRVAGGKLGPLAGVPIALKDIFDMAGVPTTAALTIHRASVADQDATVVKRLEDAGAVLLGKVTLTEGVYAEHREGFPVPVNPWHADYWPGASSSGSAVAVAAGLSCAAIGSETGGSIKLPAAANGVTALKPTWGRVSRHGVFELAATLDHVGPFGRSVADVATLMGVIAGPDHNDPTAAQVAVPDFTRAMGEGIAGMNVGIDPGWISENVDPETRAALDEAVAVLEGCGARIVPIKVPDVSEMIWDWFPICAVQTALAHQNTFPSRRAEYGPALTQLLEMGNGLSAIDYQKVILRRDDFRGRLNAMFSEIDLLAIPVLSFPVPSLEQMANIDDEMIAGIHRFTCPFNLSGNPGLVLPCGFNESGLPIVFQLVARHFEEDKLLAAGAGYQSKTQWHRQKPPTV